MVFTKFCANYSNKSITFTMYIKDIIVNAKDLFDMIVAKYKKNMISDICL